MKTILVPLDGSLLAEQILPYVRTLAPLLGAQVRLVQVLPDMDPPSLIGENMANIYSMGAPTALQHDRLSVAVDDSFACAEAYLAARALRLEEAGLQVSYDVQSGPAAEIIVEIAHSTEICMIAMATHGYSGLRRWALGSVADRVVQAAPAPVFLIRATRYPPARSFAIERVLLPLDGSDLALQALPMARELAADAGAELLLVEAVVSSLEAYPSAPATPLPAYGTVLSALRHQASCQLDVLAAKLRGTGVKATTIVDNGHAAEVIVDEAGRRNASVIVMATHGRGGLRRWAMGSVADKVLHAAAMPLVLVRARGA